MGPISAPSNTEHARSEERRRQSSFYSGFASDQLKRTSNSNPTPLAQHMSKPSLSDVRSAIDQSGYVLELRLAPKMKRGDWVHSDKQFRDQDTGKSREMDLYAHCQASIAIYRESSNKLNTWRIGKQIRSESIRFTPS